MKILAIVVTYYPEKELLEKNISAFIDHVDKVLIWENTPGQEKLNYRFIEHEKVEYHGDGINSISHGLNFGWQYAKKHGYDYLLTMDQDSLWQDFPSYISLTVNNPEVPIGIWGPNCSMESNRYIGVCKVDAVITSGMLVAVSLIDLIGGWNEFFSIDCVDDEFCLRARRKNIQTYLMGDCRLIQLFGTPKKVSFLGHTAQLRNDSPRRLFSIYKNHVVLMRMYPEIKSIKKDFWEFWISIIKWILVFENHRVKKFLAILRGMIAGFIAQKPFR